MKLKILVGSGRQIMTLALPFIVIGLVLNVMFPRFFAVGGPPDLLKWISVGILIPGIVTWIWSVILILVRVPRHELITTGPYAVVLHPLYTGVALLVLPFIGILANSWIGIFIGIVIYISSRIYSPDEEKILASIFGESWQAYRKKVLLPWL